MAMTKAQTFASWVLQIIVAAILFQTLYFKFTAAPESVYIFTKVGAEPWGRIGSGVLELIAVVLLLIPRTTVYGAILAVGVASGAILSHLTRLGVAVINTDGTSDNGLLFGLAATVFVGSAIILILHRREIPLIGGLLFDGKA